MQKISLILLMLSANYPLAQNMPWSRSFRSGDDVYYENVIYKTVEIATENIYDNTIEWKHWLLSDIVITRELTNLVDYKTQREQIGIGNIVSPVVDSGYFNFSASHRVCPLGWRLPRIGEWDTLMLSTTRAQKEAMFPKLMGYRSYSMGNVGDTIHKIFKVLEGGFWWADPDLVGNNSVKLDIDYNYDKGKGDAWDRATVRCVKEETFD
jgi:uncharacterized protein (TIGR02145 family)